MRNSFQIIIKYLGRCGLIVSSLSILSSCGGSGAGFAQPDGLLAPPVSYTVGGSVTGLSGTGLVLQNSGANNLTLNANGSFTFTTAVTSGGSYAVTVLTQPTGQICTVGNGTGSNVTSNITNVSVTCSVSTFTISGTVTGLNAGQKITLKNNGANATNIAANTAFAFSTPVAYGSSYAVTVDTQPVTQTCAVTNGSMSNVTANVSNVVVACSASSFSVLYSYGTITNDALSPTNGRLLQASDGNFYGTTATGGTGDGAIFKISPLGVESVFYAFDSSASGPYQPNGSGLIVGNDGNFYGVTSRGGSDDCGAVYRITPTGTFTVLHQFNFTTTDGCLPSAGLTLGIDGNFYGTTNAGGANNLGTVFKVTPSGTETLIYSFNVGPDGSSPFYSDLVQASDGNFYGTTFSGGATGNGTVFKVTPTGVETVVYSFAGGAGDGANPESTLTIGADGELYGNTFAGGPGNLGIVFKVTLTGLETVLHNFAGGVADGSLPIGSALVLGADGNFYSMTSAGGSSGNGVLYKMTSSGAITILHSFAGGVGDGASPMEGITVGTDGYIYGTTSAAGAFGQGVFFRY